MPIAGGTHFSFKRSSKNTISDSALRINASSLSIKVPSLSRTNFNCDGRFIE